MIYSSFRKLPNGKYHFVTKPYMDGYTILDTDKKISQLATVEYPWIYGVSRTTNRPLKETLDDMDGYVLGKELIIGKTIDIVERERVRVINRLKTNLQAYFNEVMHDLETEIKKGKFYENIEKYPEAII